MNGLSELPFRIAAVLLLVAPASIAAYFQLKWKRPAPVSAPLDPQAASRGCRSALVALPVKLAGTAIVLLYAVNPAWVRPLMVSIPNGWRWIALAIGILGLVGLYEVHRRTVESWAPTSEIREGHDLVTTGPYLLVRHPTQSVRSIVAFALSLVTANWALMVICAIGITRMYYRTQRMEAKLIERFGDRYLDYMRRTGRLVPRWKARP